MKNTQLSWLLSFHILLLLSPINNTVLVDAQCLNDQRSYLLNFKNSLEFDLQISRRLVQWNPENDCCSWAGVGCDASGRVTTLELDFEGITGASGNWTSLFRLQFLENLSLDYNHFGISIPKAIGNLTSLVSLHLEDSGFVGQIPIELSSLRNLVSLDLMSYYLKSYNLKPLKVENPTLKMLIQNLSNIEEIYLNGVDLSSQGSEWFQVIPKLRLMSLGKCNLQGKFPVKTLKVPTLQSLDISDNILLQGSLPQFPKNSSLRNLVLRNCNFSGTIFSAHFEGLKSLRTLNLANNSFSGALPKFLYELKELEYLDVYKNSFNGTIQLEAFKNLSNFTYLDLSHNNLTVEQHNNNVSLAKIQYLSLSSCKLKRFPKINNNTWLIYLDLSNNQMTGEIPNSIWHQQSLGYLNLSGNSFVGFQQPYNFSGLRVLDLRSNQLKGEVPHLSSSLEYVDLSNNSLTGSIPDSICNMGSQYLNLANNSLIGTIPSCLVAKLQVLNLARNNLSGNIPDTFPANCSLATLELATNNLQGKLPRSLSNCSMLEVLNLGSNKIEDVFPCMFENSSSLQILNLRSNHFHGELECSRSNYSWPQLQIIDIASNNFSGALSSQFFLSLKTMLVPRKFDYLRFQITVLENLYYQFKVRVNMKGHDVEFEKILTIFTSIDLSNNKFSGNIPESIGDLKALHVLDISNNEITGGIPSSMGRLSNLESLDLSWNQLSGKIPSTLQDVTFLSYLNLSFNVLTGKIPSGPQFLTFTSDFYMGNVGLCGFPLNVTCGGAINNGSSLSNKEDETNWIYVCASAGYTVGLGIFLIFMLFCVRWRNKLFLQVEHFCVKMFGPMWREPIHRL